MFADGAVVTSPTDATVGEDGPEAIMPLATASDATNSGTDLSGSAMSNSDPNSVANGFSPNNPFANGVTTAPQQPAMGTYFGGTSQNAIMSQAIGNENASNAVGNSINQSIANSNANYNNLANQFGSQSYEADQQLQQTPGYNDTEAAAIGADYSGNQTSQDAYNNTFLTQGQQSAIQGNPYAAMSYYNPESLTGETQTGNQAVDQAAASIGQGMDAAINPDLAESQGYVDSTNSAVTGEGQNMNSAIGDENTALNSSVDPSKLGVSSDYMNQEEMTPEQQQELVSEAGVTTGNSYRSAQDDLARNAQAAGNSSPLAIAAAEDRLQQQSGAAAGEAQAQAKIAASNAAAQRLQTATTTNLGANQAIAGMQQQNATTVGQQRLNAAATNANAAIGAAQNEENTRLGADSNIANLQTNAALAGGQAGMQAASQDEANTLNTDKSNQTTGQALAAAGDNTASNRALTLATNGQQAQNNENNSKFTQGITTQQLNSQGQQTLGNARIAGNTQNLNYLTGEQSQAQQGAETSQGQQIQNYGAQTGAANNATATAGNIANSKAGQPSTLGSILGGVSSAVSAFLADGAVVTQPTSAVIGEQGPEAVVPAASLQPQRSSYMGFLQNKLQNVDANGNPVAPQPFQMPQPSSPKQQAANQVGTAVGKLGRAIVQKYQSKKPDNQAFDTSDYASDNDNISDSIGNANANSSENDDDLGSMFADGGVANQPQLVTVGEQGPEAIMPLGGGGAVPSSPGQVTPPNEMGSQAPPALPQAQNANALPPKPMPLGGNPAMGSGGAVPQMGNGAMPPPAMDGAQTPMPAKSPFMGAPSYKRGTSQLGANPTGAAPQNTMRQSSMTSPTQQPAQQPPTAQRQPAGTAPQGNSRQDQMFASGAIVTKPTRAIIGEHGPEVVVPLTPRPSNKITPSMVGLNPSNLLRPSRAAYKSPRGVNELHAMKLFR